VRKATEWQAAGAFLLEGGGRLRKFWQTQLTDGAAISWWKKDAAKAAAHLKKAQAKGREIPSLLRDAVPAVIWAQADDLVSNEVVHVAEEPLSPAAPEQKAALLSDSVPASGWPQAAEPVANEIVDEVIDEVVEAAEEPPVPAPNEEKEAALPDPITTPDWPRAAELWADESAAVVELPSLPTPPDEPEETESLFPDTIPPSVWRVAEEDAVIAKSEIIEKPSSPPPPPEAAEPLFLDPLPSSIWPRATDDEGSAPRQGAEQPFASPSPQGDLSAFLEPIPPTVWPPTVDHVAGKTLESVVQRPVPPPPPPPSPATKRVAVPAAIPPAAAGEKTKSGLLAGVLIGGVTVLAAAAWVWKDAILQATRPAETAVRQILAPLPAKPPQPDTAANNPPPTQKTPPALPEQPIARTEKATEPAAKAPMPAAAAASVVAMMKPVEESPPAPVPAKPAADSPPDLPTDAWRKAEFAAVAQQFPSLVRWHTVVRTSKWREVRSLIMGTNGAVPSTGDEYPFLIKLLLLDPPLDPEVAEAVPKVAARMTNPTQWIPLFEKLTYPGSPNEKPLRQAAQAYLSASPDFLMPSLMDGLQKLARPDAKATP
jgi:hypothetical protein